MPINLAPLNRPLMESDDRKQTDMQLAQDIADIQRLLVVFAKIDDRVQRKMLIELYAERLAELEHEQARRQSLNGSD